MAVPHSLLPSGLARCLNVLAPKQTTHDVAGRLSPAVARCLARSPYFYHHHHRLPAQHPQPPLLRPHRCGGMQKMQRSTRGSSISARSSLRSRACSSSSHLKSGKRGRRRAATTDVSRHAGWRCGCGRR